MYFRYLLIAVLTYSIIGCNSGNNGGDGGTNPESNTSVGNTGSGTTDSQGTEGSSDGADTGGDSTGTDGDSSDAGGDTTDTGSDGSDTGGTTTDGGGTDSDGSTDAGEEECSVADLNQWVDDAMRDYYLYYNLVPQVDLAAYESPEQLITDLRVSPDRFSNVTDSAQQEQLFEEGITFGFGFRLVRDSLGAVRTAAVYKESPAELAGLQRGDVVMAVNGTPIEEMTNQLWSEYLGTGTDIVSPTFTVNKATGETQDISVTSGEYRLYTVQSANVATLNETQQRVGYINFLSYLGTAQSELNNVMAWLRDNEADELILDLRFNGGGFTSIARQLGSQVAGEVVFDEISERLSFNDRYAEFNYTRSFEPNDITLDLNRLYVITSGRTASSSELTINALRPYIDVYTIGGLTVGKPFVSRGRDRCGKRMHAMELISTNADGASVINGIAPDCEVFDTYQGDQGSLDDNMYSAALNYLYSGNCAAQPAAAQARSRPVFETSDELGFGSIDDR